MRGGPPLKVDWIARRRTITYLATLAFLAALAYLVVSVPWRTGPGFHTGMELSASILAAVVGVFALVRYYTRKSLTYLLMAVGFLGAALFDALHTVTSSIHFVGAAESGLPLVAAWGWFAGRTFLALLLVAAWLASREDQPVVARPRAEAGLFLGAALVAVVTFLAILTTDLPSAYLDLDPIGRPYELIPGVLFVAAFIGHWSRGAWRRDAFEHWLLLSLLVHASIHILFVPFAPGPYSVPFDAAHILKISAYTMTLFGLVASMKTLLAAAEADRGELSRLNHELTEEVSRRAAMEEHLSDQRTQLESVLEGISDGVVFVDADWRVVRANKAAERALAQPLPPGPFHDPISTMQVYRPDRETPIPPEEYAVSLALNGEPTENRLVWATSEARPGGFYLRVSAQPVLDDHGSIEGVVLVIRDVTAEVLTEQEAAEQAAYLNAIIETAKDAIVSIDPSSNITEFNPSAEVLWGYSREEVIGQKVTKLMPPRFRPAHLAGVKRYLDTGQGRLIGSTAELEALNRDGHEVPIELSLASWKTGSETGFTAIIRDISERKEAERRLRESEQTYRALVAEVPDFAIFMLDPQGHVRTWNEGAARITGYAEHEAIGRHYDTFFPPETRETGRPYELLEKARSGHIEDHGWRIRKDGTRYYARSVITTITGPDGQILGFTKITHDQTEDREAEKRLQESEERYRLLAENATDLVVVHSEDGNIHYASPAAESVTGYASEELVGARMQDFLVSEDQNDFERMLRRVVRHEERSRGAFRFAGKGGHQIWLDCIMRWMPTTQDGKGDQLLATYRDITARVHDRNALERSNQELQEFAFIASHDLKEPLRKIIAFSDRIESQCASELGTRGTDYLGRMRSAAMRMRVLLDDLLAYSRVSTKAQPFTDVDLDALAQDVVDDLDTQIEETGATVEVEPLPHLRGDPTQMRQLLQNLISNAIKYHREEAPPRVTVSSKETEGSVELVVEDNGIGFEMHYADRIFRPFQRLHGRTEYSGSGMGLAIVRKIVERHNGTVEAESTPGVGSRFIVRIPLGPESEETGPMHQEPQTHA